MGYEIYLNECLFEKPVESEVEADRLFDKFFSLLRILDRRSHGLSVVAHRRLTDIMIGFYSAAMWAGRDRDRNRRIKLIAARAPFDTEYQAIRDTIQGELEFRHKGEAVIGLGLASWCNGMAVSVDRAPWRESLLTLQCDLLRETADGDVIHEESEVACRHASVEQHVEDHAEWIDGHHAEGPRTPDELWQYKHRWFPNIVFLPNVRLQFQELGAASPAFSQVVEKLAALQKTMSVWSGSGRPNWRVHVTGEYEQREALCWFDDVDGQRRLFEQHARFTPGAGRIHFRLEGGKRRIIVAHVGRKLGT